MRNIYICRLIAPSIATEYQKKSGLRLALEFIERVNDHRLHLKKAIKLVNKATLSFKEVSDNEHWVSMTLLQLLNSHWSIPTDSEYNYCVSLILKKSLPLHRGCDISESNGTNKIEATHPNHNQQED
ncbi:unnamed protein product [Heterobilharzia americana]|nr:unnamed protein product [Heterobilharzia americana]CAH8487154.1 unnamed protein product [Heterobilharzia americana]